MHPPTSARRPHRSMAGMVVAAAIVMLAACGRQAPDTTVSTPDRTTPTPASTAPSDPATATTSGDATTSEPSPTTPTATASTSRESTTVAVSIESRATDVPTPQFAERVIEVLTDPRGWQRAGIDFRFEDDAPFRIVLAEGREVDELCRPYDTRATYSCQNGPVVALNADRWRAATPTWTGTLDGYRTMLVNHEVGHLLHLHHPRPQCPGDGLPAPVMAQQSTELDPCVANPWPLQWEIDLAAETPEPLAPPADHDVDDHRPSPPPGPGG